MKHKFNDQHHHINIQLTEEDGLNITLLTKRICIRSISFADEKDCVELFADPIVMQKIKTGIPSERARSIRLVQTWVGQWQKKNPFNVYSIFNNSSNEFMGVISIGHAASGESELSYLLHHRFWNKSWFLPKPSSIVEKEESYYGTEAVSAVVGSLIPELLLGGYWPEHKPLKKVVATVRTDHDSSQKILRSIGFSEEGEVFKFGANRIRFVIDVKRLKNDYQNFFVD